MTLDEIRRLNFRDAGSWPLLPKVIALAIILLVILIAGGLLDWRDQIETLDKAQDEEIKLKEAYAAKKAKAVNLELYVQQLREIEQSFGALLKQLPNKSEMDALLTDINQAGLGRGLQFELFRPAAQERVAGDERVSFRVLCRVADQRAGDWHLPRYGRVRERCRAIATDRNSKRCQHCQRQGHADNGCRRQDLPLSR